jgi:hypothetical protein
MKEITGKLDFIEILDFCWPLWLVLVILAIWEAEIRKIKLQARQGKNKTNKKPTTL